MSLLLDDRISVKADNFTEKEKNYSILKNMIMALIADSKL